MTDKQLRLAGSIKSGVIADLDTVVRVMTSGADRNNPTHLAAIEKIERAAVTLRSEERAQFWLDHRYDNAQSLIRQIAK